MTRSPEGLYFLSMPGARRTRCRRAAVGLAIALLLGPAARLGAQQPVGSEFQVNTYTTGYQSDPSVAIDAAGNFVVVWIGAGPGNPRGVFTRRFTAAGVPLGPEFVVNTYTTWPPSTGRVAVDALGNTAIVWSRGGPAPWGIDARILDADGAPLGAAFAINADTTLPSRAPSVASDGGGSFVATWLQSVSDGSFRDAVRGRRFGLAGPSAPEFVVVETASYYDQLTRTRVAADALGRFVVAWNGYTYVDEDTYINFRVHARRFDGPGAPGGPEVAVSADLSDDAAVAPSPTGGFVVAWAYDDGHVRHRRFGPASDPLTPVQTASQSPVQGETEAAADAKGGYLLVWRSTFPYDVIARRFDRQGFPMSPEFVVSTLTSDPRGAAVAMNGAGDFVVAWPSWNQDGDRMGVFAQRFTLPDAIFGDGFESGGVGAWQTLTPSAGDLSVVPQAALAGTGQGLRANVDDRDGVWVQDEAPNAEDRYRVQFYFDPNAFDPGEALAHRRIILFLGLSQEPFKRLVMVVLRRLDGAYAVRGRVRLDDDTLAETVFVPISDAPHRIDFDWRRGSAPGANDGSLELSVDGVPAPALTGLDNDARGIDSGRLGAITVKTGAAGVLFFDEFVSRRR